VTDKLFFWSFGRIRYSYNWCKQIIQSRDRGVV